MGEAYDRSGKDVIEAIVAGYELMCRIGKCSSDPEFNRRGFRPTAIFGVFGSGLTAGRLIGLTKDKLVSVISMAGNFCSGINEWAKAGTDEIFIQNGISSANGVLSASLVKNGISGSEKIFEGSDEISGICNAYGFSKQYLIDAVPFDGIYGISGVVCKKSPSCIFTQTTAQLAEEAAQTGIEFDEIEMGIIKTPTR